jgi:hypothetical protein
MFLALGGGITVIGAGLERAPPFSLRHLKGLGLASVLDYAVCGMSRLDVYRNRDFLTGTWIVPNVITCRGDETPTRPLSVSHGQPCHRLSRGDFYAPWRDEFERNFLLTAAFKQVFNGPRQLGVKLRGRGRFKVEAR